MIEALKNICLNSWQISGVTAFTCLLSGVFIFFYNPKAKQN